MKNLSPARKAVAPRQSSKVICASLRFGITTEKKKISAVRAAMLPETRAGKRTDMSLKVEDNGKKLILTMVSKDLTSMRASLNTNLRLVTSALKTLDAAKQTP